MAGETTVTAPSGFTWRANSRAELLDDWHLLQGQRALKVLAAVQSAAQHKMAFQQRAAVAEDLQDFVSGHGRMVRARHVQRAKWNMI